MTGPMAWSDDEVERRAKECGWDNRRYMTPADYRIWCDRMRDFAFGAATGDPSFEPGGVSEWRPDESLRRVVCAANRLSDNHKIMVLGARHWDPLMHVAASRLPLPYWEREWDQGFIDQWGRWMDRREAMKVAKAQNQIVHSIGYETDELYSEHLY